jgi:hypothetical protein
MARRLKPGESYAGRRTDRAVINCTVDWDAATLLRQYAGGKTLGRFVSRLVYEHHARHQERIRVRQELATILEEGEKD